MSACKKAIPIVLLALCSGPAVAEPTVVHHRVEVRLFPDEHRVEVTDVVEGIGGTDASFALDETVAPTARVGGQQREIVRDGGRRVVVDPLPGRSISFEYAVALPPDVQADGPFLNGEHGFLPGWATWLPAFDARESFEVTVEVPDPLRGLATGSLVEDGVIDGGHRSRFLLPAGSEPPSLFAGRFTLAEREVGGVRLRTWFTESTAGLSELYLDRAGTYVRRFEDLIGEHPYQSFAIVAAPIPVGLGFPGVTYVSERILPLPFMQTRSLAHEILHGWWGNAVRVAYDQGNWAEGLTTYLADYGILDDPAAQAAMRLEWLRDYNALPESEDGALTDFVARSHDASQIVGYNKAAMVFHMLRRRVGDDAFEAALQEFYRSHRFDRASWADLRASFEAASGDDLTSFFAQWIERPGAPRLRLQEAVARGEEVRLTIAQEQPAHRLDVPVRIETTAGADEHLVALTGPEASVSIATEGPPQAVAVDPDHHLFRHLAAGEAPPILRDVTLDPHARLVLAVPEESEPVARALAERLLGRSAPELRPEATDGPELMITVGAKGEHQPAPEPLQGRGTARVWTTTTADGAPVLTVEAEDASALQALLRPLPHYRRDSWLVFDGATVVDRGVWPGGDSPLRQSLEDP